MLQPWSPSTIQWEEALCIDPLLNIQMIYAKMNFRKDHASWQMVQIAVNGRVALFHQLPKSTLICAVGEKKKIKKVMDYVL